MLGALQRRWKGLGVVGKLSITLGLMLTLVIFVGLVATVALENVRSRTDDVVGRSMHIQRLALELESGLQQAHQAEKSFYLKWPTMGFEKARDTYAMRCIALVENAALVNENLQLAIRDARSSGIDQGGLARDSEQLSRFTRSYAESFRETINIVGRLAALHADLLLSADAGERLLLESGRDDLLAGIRLARLHGARYFASRDRTHILKCLALMNDFETMAAKDILLVREAQERLLEHVAESRAIIGSILEADKLLAEKAQEFDLQLSQLDPVVNNLTASVTDDAQGIRSGIDEATNLAVASVSGALFVAIVLAVFIFRLLYDSVGRNVLMLSNTAKELSRGNLSVRVHIESDDEFGRLAVAFNSMAGRITKLVDRLEEQAAMASDRLVEAIESISDGFALYDCNDRLVLCNSKYREIDRQHAESFRPGMSFETIIRANAHAGVYREALGREEEWVFERLSMHRAPGGAFEQRLSDGRCLLVSEYKTAKGEIVSVISDITQRKEAEEELFTLNADLELAVRERTKVLVTKARELQQANQRLLELDEMKSSFLSTVSHELRTPLTSLLGFSKLINRDFSRVFLPQAADDKSRRIGERIQSNLEIINSEGMRLTRLINDVLDLSRIETGRVEWREETMDLARVVRNAVKSVSGEFSQKPEVSLEVGQVSTLPLIHADPDRVLQVFINLLNNAAKFTEKGTVTIEGEINCHGYAVVRVRDTGVGIPQDNIESVFDKFHQVNQGDTLKSAAGGSGLGLAICRHIVERYNGHIWAESEPGQGTVMTVAFPPDCIVTRRADHNPPTVLVVDDDPAMLDLLGAILVDAGYRTLFARNGEEALDKAREYRPDLISMDLFMPGMSGREAIDRLHGDRELDSIPVLIVSVDQRSDDAGGDAVLHKPVDAERYLEIVRSLLGERILERPVYALESAAKGCGLEAETVHYCDEEELLTMLDGEFRGAVVVPDAASGRVDIDRIGRSRTVQFLSVPGQGKRDSE
ncbi:hybrid sensor histidine kinase/response regulator [Salidesulfovibrio onnuriiensis]|uniref:hybrid sensor histidine kinase/response regulator n=1 Tax=Salidesulfovibrio onnuriiensis TaxID=2583823 RepID=UPI0011C93E7F|nr:ATP-binding protein [Salidesulfovibrio onnuriiensis]